MAVSPLIHRNAPSSLLLTKVTGMVSPVMPLPLKSVGTPILPVQRPEKLSTFTEASGEVLPQLLSMLASVRWKTGSAVMFGRLLLTLKYSALEPGPAVTGRTGRASVVAETGAVKAPGVPALTPRTK